MITVNFDSIEGKAKTWVSSGAGKKKIGGVIKEYAKGGKEKTDGGSIIMTEELVLEMCMDLISMVRSKASSVPPSVAKHFDSFNVSQITQMEDGSFSADLNFEGEMSRPSLNPGKYGGVANIVAVFNNGYPHNGGSPAAISHVFGMWHGQMVHAMGSRDGMNFMQDAVEEFNGKYGSMYDVYAEVGGDFA